MFAGARSARRTRWHRTVIAMIVAVCLGWGMVSAPTATAAAPAGPPKPVGATGSAKPAPKSAPQPAAPHPTSTTPSAPTARQRAEAAAAAQARRSGKAVPIDSLTTETQVISAQPHGGFTMKLSAGPVRTKQNGAWVPIDTTLHRQPDGTIAPQATAYGSVRFSGGGTAPLVTTTSGGAGYALTWPTALPTPTVDGSTATYANVLPGVDLTMEATTTGGFSDVLVVHNADAARNPALATLNLAGHVTGGTLSTGTDGSFTVAGGHGMALHASAPMMWDSNTQPAAIGTPGKAHAMTPAAPANPDPSDIHHPGLIAHVATIPMHATNSGLSITPDQSLLTASTTAFPIYIDPTANWHDTSGTNLGFDEVKQGSPCNHVPYYNDTMDDGDQGLLGVGYNGFAGQGCLGMEHTYYQWSLPSELAGAAVNLAVVNATKVYSASCVGTTVDLTWTGGIGTGTDWNNRPGPVSPFWQTSQGFDPANCNGHADSSRSFTVTQPLQWSAQVGAGQITFMLSEDAAEARFDDTQFNRFSSTTFSQPVPSLDISYDRPPATPGGLSARSGAEDVGCATSTPYPYMGKTIATNTPVLNATVSDPDGGDLIQANYRYWIDGSSNVATGTSADGLASGTNAQFSLPPSFTSSLTNGQIVDWQAQANDGILTSGWSPVCHFIAEPVAPNPPGIISADGVYPNTATGGKAGAHAGVPGQFTISANGVGTTQFVYQLDQQPTTVNPPTSQIVSNLTGGTVSGGITHRWPLTNNSDAIGGKPLSLSSQGATFTTDATRGTVLSTDGTAGYATTSGPVLNTTNSYTVSAWVKLNNTNGFATIVSQGDANAASFYLQYSHSDNAWSFVSPSQNSTTPSSFPRAFANTPPTLNAWTHLTGVFDSGNDSMSLYVNGAIVATATNPSPWASSGQLAIGGVKLTGGAGDFFPGEISDVQLYSRALTASEISAVYNGSVPNGTLGDRWTAGEGSGSTLADSTGNHPATITGNTAWTNDTQRGNVLALDGSSGYAATSGPVLNTTNSYSVSAWVNLTNTNDFATAVSQGDTNAASFYLQYSHSDNAWAFVSPSQNSVNPASGFASAHASSPPNLNVWTHLVGTFDAGAHTMTLYVNGAQVATADNRLAWNSTGQFAIGAVKNTGGAGNFFPGEISDVQTYTRALTASEVDTMYNTVTLPITPPSPGPHTLHVYARDAAGDDSGSADYPFLVAADPPTTCTSLAACFDNTAISSDTDTGIGAYAATGGPVLNTAGSYSVSAWVKLSHTGDYYTAVGQGGQNAGSFYLQYSASFNAWTFVSPSSDATNPASFPAAHASTSPALNAWTHLVGVYDVNNNQTMSLYVNGVLAGTANNPTPWSGKGPLAIGAIKNAGGAGNFFPGSVSDVQVYPRALTQSDVTALYGGGTGTGTASGIADRWTLTDGAGTTAADTVGTNPAVLSGGALWATDTARGHALQLSGSTGADGQNTFSAGDLAAAGWLADKQVTINGATFTLPDFGNDKNDNVLAANQTVTWGDSTPVSTVGGTQLDFLVTATNAQAPKVDDKGNLLGNPVNQLAAAVGTAPAIPDGAAVSAVYCFDATNPDNYCPGIGRINFTDGTSEGYDLNAPDWITGPSSLAAVTLPHQNGPGGHNAIANGPKLYTFSVPLQAGDAGKTIQSVTLPDVSPEELLGGEALHVFGMTTRNTTRVAGSTTQSWTGAWSSPTEGSYNYQGGSFANQTFRVVIKPSVSGGQVRVKLDNALGAGVLDVDNATVAPDGGSGGAPSPNLGGATHALTFGGSTSVRVPAGGMVYSDPLSFPVTAGQSVAVSFFLANGVNDKLHDPAVPFLVEHTWSNTAWEYVTPPNQGDATTLAGSVFTGTNGAFSNLVTGLDVVTAAGSVPTTVVLGDSLVDPLQPNADALTQNDIAAELTAAEPTSPAPYGTLDAGIEANQIMVDNPQTHNGGAVGGPSALSRVDRDILDQPGVTTVILDEGMEDLLANHQAGALDPADTLDQVGYPELLEFLKTYGINVIGIRLPPCDGYAGDGATPNDPCTSTVDAGRQIVNRYLGGTPLGMGPWSNPGVPSYFYADTDGALGVPNSDGLTALDPHAAMPDHANLTATGYGALTSAYLGPQDTWRLDDTAANPSDTTVALDTAKNTKNKGLVTNQFAGKNNATLAGGASFATDPTRSEVLQLDGKSGAATTAGTVLTTTGSFTVSGWVDLTAQPTADADVISEDGAASSGFALQYDAADGRWAFGMSASDTAGAPMIRATSQFAPTLNTWTHLVGTYNAPTGTLTLYVNGAVAGTAKDTTPFAASGVLALGRGQAGGQAGAWFPGLLSTVDAWNYSLTPDQIGALYQQIH